ncbi:MAG: LicD family protein [Lachnospiraceae bacterium]|nr:LicD family protein [Lachnospiraceae bacterium]
MAGLIYDPSFFKEEERRGFLVSEVMKRSWAEDMQIIQDIAEICREQSLFFFACYGTLLGAVRERGFIPWDDDIDIGMVRDDYVRFLDIISKNYKEKYTILNPYTRSWYNMNFSHIISSNRLSFSRRDLKQHHGCPFMTGPDIYPYYYLPRNKDDERYILMMLRSVDDAIAMSRQIERLREKNLEKSVYNKWNEGLAIRLVDLQHETGYQFTEERPIENQLEILYDQICRLTEETDADYLVRYDEYVRDKKKRFPKEYLCNTVLADFENIQIPIPLGYDAILRARFGEDYIVPKQESALHGYPYYARQLRENSVLQKGMLQSENEERAINNIDYEDQREWILYYTSIREILIYASDALTQICEVIAGYEGQRNKYKLIWIPERFATTDSWAFDEIAPDLMIKYENMIDKYRRDGGTVCSPQDISDRTILRCKEYIGDVSGLADRCAGLGVKVTIQEYIRRTNLNNGLASRSVNDVCVMESTNIPKEWEEKRGKNKKIILYVMTISILYQYGIRALRKLRNVLQIMERNKDKVIMLWCLQSEIRDNICFFDEKVRIEYHKVEKEYKMHEGVILVESGQEKDAVEFADAYYGDPDILALAMKDRKKPIMIQNIDVIDNCE